jgi:predicted ATPase
MTHRPDFTFSGGGVNLTQLPLSHLGGLESTAIVTRVACNKPLPDEVVAKIIAKTDGIPLFVEELTKSLLESGVLRDDGNRFVLDEPLPPLAIPPSLQDSLMARLDRLAQTREVAQLAACIGRSFDFNLLSAVSSQNEEALYKALDQLVAAGLVHQRGIRPDITYEFKHALVRDAAYDSLLKSTRQLNHQHIAKTLEKSFASLAAAQPELIAQHYTEAGLAEPAVSWWLRAGEKSARLAANLEAIRHLECGLEILATLERNETRARIEVDMLQLLGIALKVTEGSASEHVEQVFRRSRSLCEWLHDKNREFLAQWGLWHAVMARGALDQAKQQAEQLLTLAKDIGKPALELEGHHALWGTFSITGDLVATRHHAERGIELYNFDQHGELGFEFGNHDPGVCARYSNAFALWLLGYSEQAQVQLEDAMTAARRHRHAPFLSHGLIHCIPLYVLLGAEERVGELGEEALVMTRKLANTEESAYCEFILGWAGAAQGDVAGGIEQMETGLMARPSGAFQYFYCHCLSLLAEACYRNGQIESGMGYLHEALEEIKVSNEQWCEAELHRLVGRGHLLSNNGHPDSARECFAKALEVSRAQKAKMFELRAATDLSRLLRDQGERGEALDLLDPVYQWFTEGFETTDLREAKALLEELS